MKNYIILPWETCPCGSGIQYIGCCYGQSDTEMTEKQRAYYPIKVLNECMEEVCLYPDKTQCKLPIKKAHAIQNNRILSRIQENGHVVMMNPLEKPLYIKAGEENLELNLFALLGVNKATRYPCFCTEHDDKVFAPIEKGNVEFEGGNLEQEFLYAYKAFIFEYYKNHINLKRFKELVKRLPSLLDDSIQVKKYRGMIRKRKSLEIYKDKFDKALLQKDIGGIETVVIKFNHESRFANYATFTPKYDLKGNKIK